MRMGQGSSKKAKKKVKKALFQKSEDSLEATVVVGTQISSNLIESIFQEKISQIASQQAEDYAEAVLVNEDNLSSLNKTASDNERMLNSSFLFASTERREELLAILSETSGEFSSLGNSVPRWKVHANAAKFERLLDEKYGRLRPFITQYPEIEIYLRNMQRKFNKGELSAFRQGPPPLDKKASIILLVIMHRNGARIETVFLTALFFLVGLQPWALILLVTIGRFLFQRRKSKKIEGWFGDDVKTVKSYYADAVKAVPCGDEKEIKKVKYEALSKPVGMPISPQDFREGHGDLSEIYDTMIVGSGPSSLYTAALLARTGRSVLVLSPDLDASGCKTIDGGSKKEEYSSIPVDVDCNNIAHTSVQQQILAPALCTDTDIQGGIRFAHIGTIDDGFTSDILSIPGMGCDNYKDTIPFLVRAGGISSIANDAAALLGDAWPHDDDYGDSTSAAYLSLCTGINATAKDYFMTKLLPDKICDLKKATTYQEASIRFASGFLDKGLPYNPHVRSLMAGIGMRGENIPPSKTSMAAQVTSLCACASPDGFSYPVGGPRALCHAFANVIEQNGGKVVTNVDVKEFLFENIETGEDKEVDEEKYNELVKPRCHGVRLVDDRQISVGLTEDGCVVSMLGFIDTFIFKMPDIVRTKYGMPIGLPALSERCPVLKFLFCLNGDSNDLSLTGADWYRLPNASLPIDEKNAETGEVVQGKIGVCDDEDTREEVDGVFEVNENSTNSSRGKRMKNTTNTKKKTKRIEFISGHSWMKVAFPSAKDPSWKERYSDISTCVVTIEAGSDFVRAFETSPKVYSATKCSPADINHLVEKVSKDLLQTFPQLDGKILSCKMEGLTRVGLSHDPQRFAVKGIRPKTPYPGLFVGGSDLTVGDSFSASTVSGWMVANSILGYSFFDYLFLDKNITSDISQFLAPVANDQEDLAVPLDEEIESAEN